MITYVVRELNKIPKSCAECTCYWCDLPLKRNARGGATDKIKKEYTDRRHAQCPLREVK